jgi:membrane-bound lytic murein transglycosylase D
VKKIKKLWMVIGLVGIFSINNSEANNENFLFDKPSKNIQNLNENKQKITPAKLNLSGTPDEFNPEDIDVLISLSLDTIPALEEITKDYNKVNLTMKIDLTEKTEVKKWLHYYQKRAYRSVYRHLQEGKQYIPVIKQIFEKYGIPDDFIFLPIIESRFYIKAKSPAGAAGLWQFMPATGRMYGLRIDKWVDERFDPVKSTEAAAQYLQDLYRIFDDWMLALASYNTGEGAIIRKINKYGGTNFWDINDYLSKETRNYVPSFLAVEKVVRGILKAEHFNYNDISFEEVNVKNPVSIKYLSEILDVPYKELKKLNPHLKHGITPPNAPVYHVYVPKGYGEIAETLLEKSPLVEYKVLKEYSVKKGDSLIKVAKKFGTTTDYLKKINHMKSNVLIADSFIKVPSKMKAYPMYIDKVLDLTEDIVYTSKGLIYKVKPGDSLASIAKKFKVSVKKLKRWNKIDKYIYPNQKIVIYKKVKKRPAKIVGRNDRNIKYLKKRINKRVPKFKYIYHKVKPGDSLIKIAKKYGVSVKDIKKWNRLKGNIIVVGDKITVIKRITKR